jgi:signal transduction histidine kinase
MDMLRSKRIQSQNPDNSQGMNLAIEKYNRDDSNNDKDDEDEHDEKHKEDDSEDEDPVSFPLIDMFEEPPAPYEFDRDLFDEARSRVMWSLVLLSTGVISASGGAAYFLAGRTLKPIELMMDEQKRFISDASHELRTPLTAMKTEIEVTLRDQNLSSDEARDVLQSNLEEVDKLKALSDRLLTLGRLQSQNKNIEFSKCNVSDIGEEAISQVVPMAVKKNMEIEFEPIIDEGAIIEAFKSNLVDMLVILLDNAIKYSQNDSIVGLRMTAHKDTVSIIVDDNGIGISQEDLPNLFKRFYRADTARSRGEIEGYGLGLSIAKGFIERHNGTIRVESQVGKGTRFTITLPRKQSGRDQDGKLSIRII